jgi:AcrR family transcriptional regulator
LTVTRLSLPCHFVSVKIDRYNAPMASDTPYHHGDLKLALLSAGDDVLRDRGLQGFTLRECARRAGVSHAAPKHHFGDAAGFLTALAIRGFERLLATLREELAKAGERSDARMAATTRAYFRFADDWPEHFRIMFRADLLNVDDEDFLFAARSAYTEMTNVVLTLRGEPPIALNALHETVKTADIMNDILLAWCFVHGYAHLRIEEQLSMVPESHHDELIRTAAKRLAALIGQ